MPRRRRVQRRRNKRSAHFDQYISRSILTPASTLTCTIDNLPKTWGDRGFTLLGIKIHAIAYDSATVNKLSIQPTQLQLRIMDPNTVVDVFGKPSAEQKVLWSSTPSMFSINGGTRHFRFPKVRIPLAFAGSIFAVDCLCPQEGWEGGAVLCITISANLGNIIRGEACKQLVAHPSDYAVV